MRTRKSLINLATGLAGQGLALLASLALRVCFARYMSAEYLGLSGLFTNILSMLSLVELGVGPAITFSLYKSLAYEDKETTKSLMCLYQTAYRIIGAVILILGFLFTPFYPVFIKDTTGISDLNLIYWLYVINTGISYFYSYKVSLIIADQNQYIKNIGHYTAYVCMHILQALILIFTQNYILFLVCQIVFTFAENLILSNIADRMYPFLKEKSERHLEKEETEPIIRNIKAMLCHNVGNMVVNSTDSILISRFFGLVISGAYSNYALVLQAVRNILARAFDAVQASVGNLYAQGNQQRLKQIYDRLHFLCFWLFGFCAIALLCLMQPFISLFFGDDYLLNQLTLVMLVISFYTMGMRSVLHVMRAAAGLYYRDWYKPIAESIVNLVASVLLLKQFGVAGVFMGTIVSTVFVGTWVEAYIVHAHMLDGGLYKYLIQYMQYALVTLFVGSGCYMLLGQLSDGTISVFVGKILLCTVLVNGTFALIYRKNESFVDLLHLAKKLVRK